jgi:primosomal protein N'
MSEFECRHCGVTTTKNGFCKQCGGRIIRMDGLTSRELAAQERTEREDERDDKDEEDEN